MRGGTSKGVFFHAHDLPMQPSERDQILLRVMGSPDPYGKQIDGMGGASSSTSKVVIINKSTRSNCDVDYLRSNGTRYRTIIIPSSHKRDGSYKIRYL